MSRSGLEIDRDTGNIIREGCGSCVVKVWVETNPFTGEGHYREPISLEHTKKDSSPKPRENRK